MISSVDSALSALIAFQKKVGVTANNIANIVTPGFKRSRTDLIESPGGGVHAVIEPVRVPGATILEETAHGPDWVEQSNVDPAEEMVEMIVAQRAFQANVRMLQGQDKALGMLLDRRD